MINVSNAVFSGLQKIETAGNKLPHPTILFIYLCVAMVFISMLAAALGISAEHPVSHIVVQAKSLVSADGLAWVLTNTVTNFTHFAPVGTVLVAILGLGIAERSGLIGAVLTLVVSKAPSRLLTFIVVLAGVLSSLAADAGYVVLIPLAAMLFLSMGRSPLLGIAAAFAGVSGGYSANLMIGPLDAVLSGLSTEAVAVVDSSYTVSAAGNYYFIAVSTLFIALLATWVTEVLIAPRFTDDESPGLEENAASVSAIEVKAMQWVAGFTTVFIALLLVGLLPTNGALRDAATGSIVRSPFVSGIVSIIALYAALAGVLYGRITGHMKSQQAIVSGMEASMATMAGYLVLMFFAAQFVNYFKWTDLGFIVAINGAAGLSKLGLGPIPLLMLFMITAGFINLFIGSASAKWALLAPVFVPMFYLLGITPEATQLAYRIGDSTTNIITPLMPYFGVVVAFAQRYKSDTGIGTIMALMLPYSVVMFIGWAILLAVWMLFGWPLGPGAAVLL